MQKSRPSLASPPKKKDNTEARIKKNKSAEKQKLSAHENLQTRKMSATTMRDVHGKQKASPLFSKHQRQSLLPNHTEKNNKL